MACWRTYLLCRPHGHVFAGQSAGRVSIRWDHKWHKLTDEHFRIVGFPVESPTDCWRIENCCVNWTFCRRFHSNWPLKTNAICLLLFCPNTGHNICYNSVNNRCSQQRHIKCNVYQLTADVQPNKAINDDFFSQFSFSNNESRGIPACGCEKQ